MRPLRATPQDPGAPRPARRLLLQRALALAGATVAGVPWPARAAGVPLAATPPVALGPFYPPNKPADSDADLTVVAGRPQRAAGTLLYVSGRVLDTAGRPLPGAAIELWQANAFGRYLHPADTDASGPLDPGFQGYGRLVADADGRYRVKTIKPPPYSGRTPHIHFIVAGGGARLTTQMFFEGEPGNERDGLYRYLGRDDRRSATGRFVDRASGMEPDALAASWDIVLRASG
ncbi:MAG: protocatechuate 3,4-dioxygenase [Burkholderiales bacterium]